MAKIFNLKNLFYRGRMTKGRMTEGITVNHYKKTQCGHAIYQNNFYSINKGYNSNINIHALYSYVKIIFIINCWN